MKNLISITKQLRFALLATLFGAGLGIQTVSAQTAYKAAAGSQIKVSGTSTMHNWSMQAGSFTCDANFLFRGSQLQDISSLSLILPVTNLKSKDDLMDSRAYKALNSEKYANISFRLTSATVVPQQNLIKATGNLTISGVTNAVSLQASYVLNADETITCKASRAIKMSDFKIKAPSFMLGTLKTGNELTIDILLKLKKVNTYTASN